MNFKRIIGKVEFDIKKKAPALALGAGIILSGISIIEFCRKSREGLPVIDEYKQTVEELVETHDITHDDAAFRKDFATETLKTGVELGKIYAKPTVLYLLSVGLSVKSYSMMHERNVALIAAYAGVGNELRRVYSRIAERYGDEALDEIKHNIKKVEVEEQRIDEKTGSEVVDKKMIPVVGNAGSDPTAYSPYARFFNDTCAAWRDDSEYNLTFLLEVEYSCNRLLRERGYLFLNEVYDMLGMKRSKAGQKVGWKYYKNGDNPCGDNMVSLGIHNINSPAAQDFVNGFESVILLDFNVDGEIIDTVEW